MSVKLIRGRIDPLPVAQEVAKFLDGWTLSRWDQYSAYLQHRDGLALDFSASHRAERTHVIISADYPGGHEEWQLTHGLPRAEISVAVARGSQVIASEITRRLLPAYDKGMTVFLQRLRDNVTRQDARDNLARRLVEILNTKDYGACRVSRRLDERVVWHDGPWPGAASISYDGKQVEFRITAVADRSCEFAAMIVAILCAPEQRTRISSPANSESEGGDGAEQDTA